VNTNFCYDAMQPLIHSLTCRHTMGLIVIVLEDAFVAVL